MENKKQLLEKLKKENEELKPIISKSFQSSTELDAYYNKNIKSYKKYDSNLVQIRQLEYELKTPEEKKEYDEYLRKLKLKSEGKPLI